MRLDGLDRTLFRVGDRVYCAVSGGADSVGLLLTLLEANAERKSLGIVLRAVHVHHGLRGAEADADEAFVRDLCGRVGVPLAVERVDTPARQSDKGEGMEEAARELRYESFRRLMSEGRADVIATAHTMDDQAETVLMKLLRGAWTEGLSGIFPLIEDEGGKAAPRSGAAFWGAEGGRGRFVRPLLEVRRAEIEAFLRERDQPWREDSSNADQGLTRNRVRHELMPMLRSFNPSVDRVLARTAAIARDEESFWKAEVEPLLAGLVLPGKPVRGGGRAVSTAVGQRALALELDRLRVLAPALRRRLVRAAAGSLGCRISAEETVKLLALGGLASVAGLGGRIGARLELGGGLRAERSARELRLSRTAARGSEDVEEG